MEVANSQNTWTPIRAMEYKEVYNRTELERLHLHFFHSSAQKLLSLLKRGTTGRIQTDTSRLIQDIVDKCQGCQRFGTKPYRFRVSLPNEEIIFNHEVALDLFWLSGNPVLHIVDTYTGYQNIGLPKTLSAQHVWDTFLEAWVTVYVGYPNRIRGEQGSVFTCKLWGDVTSIHGIELQLSGIENHNSIGIGERYHAPIRRIFRFIRAQNPRLDSEISLRLAVKAANDTLGPKGQVPAKLVYGIDPAFPVVNASLQEQRDRMAALEAAKREMATITAENRVKEALRAKLPPSIRYDIEPRAQVLVFRERSNEWKGPYCVTKIFQKEVFLDCDGKEKDFNLSQVIPMPQAQWDREIKRLVEGMGQFRSDCIPGVLVTEVLDPCDERANSSIFDVAKAK